MNRKQSDAVRVLILLVVTGILLYLLDSANVVVAQALLIGVFFVGGSHLTRRLLFHRLDLQTIAEHAVKEKNMPAAIVFLAICAFLVAVMVVSLGVIR